VRVPLVWWRSSCDYTRRKRYGIHWGESEPECHLIMFECLGLISSRSRSFNIEGVTLEGQLPMLTDDEKLALVKALRSQVESRTGWTVNGLRQELIDWEGV